MKHTGLRKPFALTALCAAMAMSSVSAWAVTDQEILNDAKSTDQIVTNESGIPKSREKFYQREQKFKKRFDAKLEQWRKEAGPTPENVGSHKEKSNVNKDV